ncbi:hypothetical protein SKAU_G00256190 [Synaphobranchus kaupii]|uniref:Uncharacterized protein n=1 Tax=Synaphobranchus kaupii TaxID=118154 RepID=A0A9Q1F3U4_SYNKA|nr:hypothetical protein SKAU_G00256190 [Synaphobranchus kaupii]
MGLRAAVHGGRESIGMLCRGQIRGEGRSGNRRSIAILRQKAFSVQDPGRPVLYQYLPPSEEFGFLPLILLIVRTLGRQNIQENDAAVNSKSSLGCSEKAHSITSSALPARSAQKRRGLTIAFTPAQSWHRRAALHAAMAHAYAGGVALVR